MKRLTAERVRRRLPRRSVDAHKGDCGRILIVAGSRMMMGAGVLSVTGALRAGAGLARLATVESRCATAAKRVPLEATLCALPETSQGLLSRRAWSVVKKQIESFQPTVIAVGPGLGVSAQVRFVVLRLLQLPGMPLVLDADALNVLRVGDLRKKKAFVIVTPHEGELARLLKTSSTFIHRNRVQSARRMAIESRCICILKGARSLLADATTVLESPRGHSSMASGGMGDVLTGIVAALWGQYQQQTPATGVQAACCAVYVHGLAGEITYKKEGGLSVSASAVAETIPKALRQILKKN